MKERGPGSRRASRRGSSAPEASLAAFGAKPTRRRGSLVGGRYRIEGRLGQGGTSEVYLAVDTATRRSVVVKQLSANGMLDRELRARFVKELRAMSRIDHQNVARVLDFAASEDERPYLVMEALLGESLGKRLKREPMIEPELALTLCRQCAAALQAAHAAGVVHRDVKPDNLFLSTQPGQTVQVRLLDFGMAKLTHSHGTSGSHTVLGTVEYMAPEQVMADPVDAHTDVYGLGIVMFRLFTGHLPFESNEGLDLLSHQIFSPVPPASWLNESLDPRLDAIIARATRKHPVNRYPSMGDLLADLDIVADDSPSAITQALLQVEPDVYEPTNPSGREVARLLAQKYQTIAPAVYGLEEERALISLLRSRS